MKTCFKCGAEKEPSEFYKHRKMSDGLLGKCKDCTKSDALARYKQNRVSRKRYEQERGSRPERKLKQAQYLKTHRLLHPDKAKARHAVGNALRDGRLTKLPCRYCGSHDSEAHHHDYSKHLDVTWACFKCHRQELHGQTVVDVDP